MRTGSIVGWVAAGVLLVTFAGSGVARADDGTGGNGDGNCSSCHAYGAPSNDGDWWAELWASLLAL